MLRLRAWQAAGTFAKNDMGFVDRTGVDHGALGVVPKTALYNYMHGIGRSRMCATGSTRPCPRPA